jgi:hypothetical protein
MTTRTDRRAEAAKKRRKQIDDLRILGKNRVQDRKIRKLRTVDKRGKVVGQKKKMSTFKAQSSYDIAKQQSGSKTGMSNLGAGYKKAEKNFSEEAAKKSAKISKARYPKMGTYKNKDGKSVADEKKKKTTTGSSERYGRAPKGYIKYGSKFVSLRTAQGKKALNKLKAKQRAQAAAKKRLANK